MCIRDRPYPKLTGIKVNGRLVRDQGLGDIAGMELAETAMAKALAGATADNRKAFYEGWSHLWAQQMSCLLYTSSSAARSCAA